MKRFDSSEGNVFKYVFDFGDAIAEAVLYKYESFYKRTVLCISVQSGCPVGCIFCGTGKKFIRNLTVYEIVSQVTDVLKDQNIEDVNEKSDKFQIMFMSMGEPFLNYENVEKSIETLHRFYPNADLLVSTMGPNKDSEFLKFCQLSVRINKVGLQFSVHRALEEERNKLIPFKNKMNLRTMRDASLLWHQQTKRVVFINYCIGEDNRSEEEFERLKDLFSPCMFNFTFSVICSPDENMKTAGFRNLDILNKISKDFLKDQYNVRVFDPAGQDDIGGGCGQLWYVQKWIKERI